MSFNILQQEYMDVCKVRNEDIDWANVDILGNTDNPDVIKAFDTYARTPATFREMKRKLEAQNLVLIDVVIRHAKEDPEERDTRAARLYKSLGVPL